ncbi:putative transmembrane drug efflux protein [Candidatus Rhodobacter oscarellae]|uniref:Putative transmembrane drug efflux protein n=1 Tax=Candidatus Rhodobacter oscarellae TaxID=1675527 RepID=A0A0J9EA91_9RHOB|nr:efflux RND transporter permease subunit [Candidatus Rhodobacter lobularis]KMW59551.1 putative transmembrane drug efflux protein [Candidatus Rhodobacter lobularis]
MGASAGGLTLNLNVYNGVPSEKLPEAFQDIRNKMDDAADDLPDGMQGPTTNTNYGDVAIATVAVTGEGFDYAEIWDAADALRSGLDQVDGITKVTISGDQDPRIWLEIDSQRLAAMGVQINRVLNDLQAQNVVLPAGRLDEGGKPVVT